MLTGTMNPGLSWGAATVATSLHGPLIAGVPARLSGGTSFQSFGPDLSLPGHAMAAGRCWSVCAS